MTAAALGSLVLLAGWLSSVAGAARWTPFEDREFEAARRAEQLVVLQFVEKGCAPCDEQEKALARLLGNSRRQDLAGFQVDLLRHADLARRFGVRAPTTLLLLRGAHEKARAVGSVSEAGVSAFLAKGSQPDPRGRPPPRSRTRPPMRP
ncbi:MAG: thioredoxin family protein [Elusimicrobia bacterium]|nr:thioredoxin family protein [Elusimicrobiota bacterium]